MDRLKGIFSKPLSTFVLGVVLTAGLAFIYFYTHTPAKVTALRESDITSGTQYKFTDPLIGLSSSGQNAPEYAALNAQITSYINQQTNDGLSSASVKFSDIQASEGFTINTDEIYDPASLTKVPLAMAYYDIAEENPPVLSESITYSGDVNLDADEQIKSPVQLTPGESYTVEDLIEHMIRYSDNNAEQLLADHLAQIGEIGVLNSLFDDLGIKISPSNPDYITVQSYTMFIRVLYNATYLDRDYSEKLLQLLSQSDFTEGIVSGLPDGTVVSQKFGDARIPDAQGNIVGAELQDCGIVYYPDHPYILCIMTKGNDIPDLERIIGSISQQAFQAVQNRYPSQ